ncbi:YbjQ family protein [Pirellulaceae bacterium SH449]
MEFLIGLLFTVVPLFVFGVLIGRWVEKSHLRTLVDHEQSRQGFLVTQLKTYPNAISGQQPPSLLTSEVVIASDYLKNFLASWRNLFGGEVRSYSRMADRSKREAIRRLVDQARGLGYNALCNVRVEAVEIGERRKRGAQAMSCCIAYGTAYYYAPSADTAKQASDSL